MKKSTALKVNQKFYYGWVILFVSAVSMLFSAPGQTYSISAFIDAYIDEFGFSRTSISTIYSGATLASGFLLIIIGKLVDRYGQRVMLVGCGLLLALTTVYNSFIMTVPMMTIGFFFLRYFGQGSLTLIPNTLVPQWFKKKRGLAFSIFKFGGAVGSVIVPIINVYCINTYGWRTTWRIWGIVLMVVFVPIVYLLTINTPEKIGLKPDNMILEENEIKEDLLEIEKESWHASQAVRTKAFWILGFCVMLTPMTVTGVGFHFYSIMQEKMMVKSDASILFGLMGIPGFVFPFIAGYYLEKTGPKIMLMGTLIVQGTALFLVAFSQSTPVLIGAIMLFGSGTSVQFMVTSVMWPNFFGRKYLGTIQALATIFVVIGSALGPIPFGVVYDRTGSYYLVLIGMGVLSIVGGMGAYFANKPIKGIEL